MAIRAKSKVFVVAYGHARALCCNTRRVDTCTVRRDQVISPACNYLLFLFFFFLLRRGIEGKREERESWGIR